MKIAIVQNVTLNDHRSVHSHNVACELQKRGYTVDLILQKSDEIPQFKDLPYNLIEIPGDTYSIAGQITFMKALVTHIKKEDYHIIHAKNPFSSVFVPVILRKMGVIKSGIIYDMRGLWVDFGVHAKQFSPVMGTILNRTDLHLMQWCDHVIAISQELKKILTMRGIPEDKITVIEGSGVNITEIDELPTVDVRTLLGITGAIIGYVGTVSVQRQSEKLINAFKTLYNYCKDCYLLLIGPADEDILQIISKADNVISLGFLPHERALSLLKSFDVAVAYHDRDVPFFNVAVPIKILEYLAAGIPVVATDHVMYKNVITHKNTGFLTACNPELFAEGVLTVLKDANLRKSLAEEGRKKAEEYSIKALVDQIEHVYENVLTQMKR
ncbi:MAG: glycosyltransferase family 4 protein [Theionarchaea archaeon]|nr:glycosyltransferase family 4 protein [Theionarchaea archaeon]